MAQYIETYLLNASDLETTGTSAQTIVPNLALKGIQQVALTLRGVVFTAQSNGSVEIVGATIVIYDPNGNAIAQGTSATSGPEIGSYTLSFDGELNVNYTVTISANQYDSTTQTISFINSLNVLLISLLKNDSSLPAIYGRVLDEVTGLGIPDANVNIAGNNVVVNVTTMSDGTFLAYDHFQTGVNYTVMASKLGYNSTQQNQVQILPDTAGRYVLLSLNQNTSNLTSIVGRVILEGSKPVVGIANALVGLYLIDDNATLDEQLVMTVLSDEYGSYTFNNVAPEKNYIIKAIKVVSTKS